MFILQIVAFLLLILGIAWKCRIRFVEAVPVGSSLLVLGLYLLSFFRALSLSDGIAAGWVVLWGVFLLRMSREKRKELLCFVGRELASPASLTALVMTVVMTICVGGKVVSWWDDYNFWATDAKAIFYLDGFAGKYTNVAAEFGDYPPGTQLMKWWFLHFSPGEFREGLMFAGYYFFNLSFLFPLLKILDTGRGAQDGRGKDSRYLSQNALQHSGEKYKVWLLPLQMAAGGAALWLFPAVAEAFWCDGCCADLTMALVYGAFLVSVADREGHGRLFYYGRQALFLMVLVLCKNTGFLWVAFGLLFDYGYHFLFLRRGRGKKGSLRPLFMVTVLPVLTELSWLGFCLWNRRVAKLTGTAIQMATGGMNIPAYQSQMVKAFVEAFLVWPLHRGKTPGIDLSPMGLFLLLLLFVWALWRLRVLEGKKAAYLGGFLAVTGVVFYSINLISHLTIFAVETQYLEPFGMVSSIERYGAPFAIGGLYLLAFFAMGRAAGKAEGGAGLGAKAAMEAEAGPVAKAAVEAEARISAEAGALACLVFVLLTTDYGAAYRALYGYRGEVEEILKEREEIIDDRARDFLATVQGAEAVGSEAASEKEKGTPESAGAVVSVGKGFGGRVLYLRDISDVSWVRNTYVGFAASPVSVMYANIDVATADSQTIINALEQAHAGFLYVDRLSGEGPKDGKELFQPFMDKEEFSYGCLYQVQKTGEEIFLRKAN